ncbi:MAG: GLUG motif-containing protein [Sedimentisphaerales bacterium]
MKTHQFSTIVITNFVFVLFIVTSANAAPWAGSGTSADPYQIWDANGLNAIGADPNYYGSHFKLMADINLAGITYTDAVIPYSGTAFTGVFDGNTHIITNLTINTSGANTDYLGLFGGLDSGAVLKDVGIKNLNITAGDSSQNIGALAGINAGTIQGCFAQGAITDGNESLYVGGLVGTHYAIIQNCYADVDVNAGASSQNIGGLIGMCYYFSVASNCYAAGHVSGGIAVGGFAGSSNLMTLILNCYFLHPDDGGGPDNGIGIVLTDAQMRQQSSFAGWDFFAEAVNGTEEIWKMNGYPVLSWQIPVGLREFAMLGKFWMEPNCPPGEFCSTVDWYTDGRIDINDLAQLCKSWLRSRVATDYPRIGDNFETGDFSALPWVQGGSANWVIESDTVWEGTYAAKSGAISHSQGSSIEFTIDTGVCEIISFYCKISSESGFDELVFYIDGSLRGEWSGEYDWSEITYNFAAGVHTFKWSYYKDASVSRGSDCAWLDNIRLLKLVE